MYDTPTEVVLRRIVDTSHSPRDLEQRVRGLSMGDEMLPNATRMALEIRGSDWLVGEETKPPQAARKEWAGLPGCGSR